MSPNINPFVYIFPAVLLGAIALYLLYSAINKLGLEETTTTAIITGKTHTPGTTSYVSRMAGGRSWVQAQKQPDFYTISLTIGNEQTMALVTKEKFDSLSKSEEVQVKTRRTRLTKRLEVVNVK